MGDPLRITKSVSFFEKAEFHKINPIHYKTSNFNFNSPGSKEPRIKILKKKYPCKKKDESKYVNANNMFLLFKAENKESL